MRTKRSRSKRPRRNKELQHVDQERAASCVVRVRRAFALPQQGVARLTVNRTNLHIYASVISGDGSKVLASASTAEAEVRAALGGSGKGGNAAAAQVIGKRLAEKAKAGRGREGCISIAQVSHTTAASRRLADAAREAGSAVLSQIGIKNG
jgi:large subunit ribosomal protein L18